MSKARRIEALEAQRAAEEAAWEKAEQALLMRAAGTLPRYWQIRVGELARLIGGADTEAQAAAYFETLKGWEDPEPWPEGLVKWAEDRMGIWHFEQAPTPAEPEAWASFLKRAAEHTEQAARQADSLEHKRALELLTAYRLFLAALLEDWRAQNPMTDPCSK